MRAAPFVVCKIILENPAQPAQQANFPGQRKEFRGGRRPPVLAVLYYSKIWLDTDLRSQETSLVLNDHLNAKIEIANFGAQAAGVLGVASSPGPRCNSVCIFCSSDSFHSTVCLAKIGASIARSSLAICIDVLRL
jgi:hypothetical protein